jgi:hypothetical protein
MKDKEQISEVSKSVAEKQQSWLKRWSLNFLAVVIGLTVITGILGVLDILAQKELRKTGVALPKICLWRGVKKVTQLAIYDPFLGYQQHIPTTFPNLVDDYLPYIIAGNYNKIFIRPSDVPKFESHSVMESVELTPELIDKLERPIIVCLGGSTTEAFLSVKTKVKDTEFVATGSWAEELSRTMETKGIRGTVICSGTSGYRTGQDFLKLIRDILEIKPDIVISYGGVNDLGYRPDGHPLYYRRFFEYLKRNELQRKLPTAFLFPNLVRLMYKKTMPISEKSYDIYYGVKSTLTADEYMIRNWKMMNEICVIHDIDFYGILQPCVGSTEKTRGNDSFVTEKWKGRVIDEKKWDYSLSQLISGYDSVQQNISKYKFMYDFSDIFDNENLEIIYPFEEDFAHVSNEGNRIVAKKIFEMLFGEKKIEEVKDGNP